jgi:hypothetical protein
MDPSKLSPAPWASVWLGGSDNLALVAGKEVLSIFGNEADCDFGALARNAFDVMMRRGWEPLYCGHSGWSVQYFLSDERIDNGLKFSDDPFTALVRIDEWYRINFESKPCVCGHTRQAHEGHTYTVAPAPSHCSQGCGCIEYRASVG